MPAVGRTARRGLNALLRTLGYELVKRVPRHADGYVLYTFNDDRGHFDYERYRALQTEGNKKKLDRVWVQKENIEFLSEFLKRQIGQPSFGICHGTRRGLEQQWFAEHLGCEVIGTEISDTADQFPNTIRWDFHEVKEEWLERCDFIYSNSFDQTYNPEHCLNQWLRCIRPGGVCILEHSSDHDQASATPLDPFGADLVQVPFLIMKWSRGAYAPRWLLEAPRRPSERVAHVHFIVLQKF